MRRGIGRLAVAALVLAAAGPAGAWDQPSSCDYLDGEGYIVTTANGTHNPAKAEFCVTAGCKNGSPWGHLEYIDKGTRLNVHATSITAYVFVDQGPPTREGDPTGTRQICGRAKTNQFGYVDFWVQAKDTGEPDTNDEFIIRLVQGGQLLYTTEGDADHTLGGSGTRRGGELELEKPNRWKPTGAFSHLDPSTNCPAAPPPSCPAGQTFDQGSQMCVPECPAGQTFDQGSQMCVCPGGQTFDQWSQMCVCPDGQTFDQGSQMCVCPGGQTFDQGSQMCVCPDGQTFDQGSQMCVPQCPDGQTFDTGRGMCVTQCAPGEMLCPDGITCIPEGQVCVD